MIWLQRYRLHQSLKSSVWIYPVCGMAAALVAVRLVHRIDVAMNWQSSIEVSAAQTVLATLAASIFTLIVFVCSALLLAVQLASAQLTPRVILLVFRNPAIRFSLTLFMFTFTFALASLLRIKGPAPLLTIHVAGYSAMLSLGAFLYLIEHVGKSLRPSRAVRGIARQGRDIIQSVYPTCLKDARPSTGQAAGFQEEAARTVASAGDGVILAVNFSELLALAERNDCIIELAPQVGDSVGVGETLFRIYRARSIPSDAQLCCTVALGDERTMEQDPTFPIRMIVDIASKALSPAINDPTTAVVAIDQIERLLLAIGERDLSTGRVRDSAGRLRLVYRTPDWEDFVHLAITEIRQFGGSSIQVARRLRAMLDGLIHALPAERLVLLHQERALLTRSAERFFSEPEDRILAGESDAQGVGGKSGDGPADAGSTDEAD